jgi:sugar O-acyltransferase (sialic acid O-acetyltransferase NeuD family)
MKDLIILGTGVHAAEMVHIVERVNAREPTWRLLGHIAPKGGNVPAELAGTPVLGTAENLGDYPSAKLVPDNEFPKSIEIPAERLVSLVDPDTYVHPTASVGPGCVLYPNCFVGFRAVLGDRVFALCGVTVNHDDAVGDRTVFASGATLAGNVTVEEDCYMGQSSTVRQFVRIGRGSMIGMGAVVVKDVEPYSVMAGNPARKLRSNKPDAPVQA